MKFNFKKIGSIIASSVMLASTIGFAAATNYPDPFVKAGTADGAVVFGVNANPTDMMAAIDVQQSLGTLVTSATGTTTATVTGEATPLFSGGTKLYINDSLSSVKTVVTKANLPLALADGSFSGNVDATFTQKIDIGTDPRVTFTSQPSSSDDPRFGLTLSTSTTKYIYNETVTFSKAINASHSDSEGEELDIFGSKFTIGSATDGDTLVLLKSAEKINLDSSNNPSQEVTVAGKTYTIELVSATDTSATIKVTDSSGNSDNKKIDVAASKKINGVTIAIQTADENNFKLSASIIVGTDKITLEDGNNVKIGEDDKIIDGTKVGLTGGITAGTMPVSALTAITVSVFADNSDEDAILPGESFVDPVFGTIKVDFSGFNIDSKVGSTDTSRDTISFSSSGDDKELIKLTNYDGYEKSIQFFKNQSSLSDLITSTLSPGLQCSDNGNNLTVVEGEKFHKDDCVVVGNEDSSYLLKLKTVRNSTSPTASDDQVEFEDMFSGSTYRTTFTNNNGAGTIDIGGISYTVTLEGIYGIDSGSYNVSLDYPDSSTGAVIMYPMLQTKKGAKVMFYEPKSLFLNSTTISDPGQTSAEATNISSIKFPNGADGYTSVTITHGKTSGYLLGGATCTGGTDSVTGNLSLPLVSLGNSTVCNVGQLKYNFSVLTSGKVNIRLLDALETSNIDLPAVVVLEEKDDNAVYEGLIVELDSGANSDDGVGIASIESTWDNVGSSKWYVSRHTDSKKSDGADLWGTIYTLDATDSDQKSATISYPDEQIYAQIYVAEDTAAITPGTASSSAGGQVLIVKDSEISSVSGKNLLVVGGSCINAVAAKILGSDVPLCGDDFTAKTQVGAGQYIIKTVASPYNVEKIAMLVAGYNAADTVNAVAKAKEGASTDISAEGQVYPIVSASA